MVPTKIEKIMFSPTDNIIEEINNRIKSAKEEIYIMHFWFTWKPIADALVSVEKSVNIKILVDKRSLIHNMEDEIDTFDISVIQYLKNNEIDNIIIYDGTLLHHKTMIIDSDLVIFGSLNFYRNSIIDHLENCIIISDKDLNKKFKDEFIRISDNYGCTLDEYVKCGNANLREQKLWHKLYSFFKKIMRRIT